MTSEQSYSANCEPNPESSDVLQMATSRSKKIKDHEKYELITSSWNNLGDVWFRHCVFHHFLRKEKKTISFQKRWLQNYKWLCDMPDMVWWIIKGAGVYPAFCF